MRSIRHTAHTLPAVAATILVLAAVSPSSSAADRPPEREAVYRTYLESLDRMVAGGQVTPGWLSDGSSFWYSEGSPADRVIYRVDPVAGTKEPMFDIARLRSALEEELGYEPPYAGVPFDRFAELPGGMIQFALEGAEFTIDLATYEVTRLPGPDPMEEFFGLSERANRTPGTFPRQLLLTEPMQVPEVPSPDGKYFATVRDGNLGLKWTTDGRYTALTEDAEPDFNWDLESGRIGLGPVGPAPLDPWSPDGLKLFAMKMDRRHVPKVPQVHYLKAYDEVTWIYVQKAGGPLDRAELYMVDILGRRTIPVDLGDTTDQYFVLLSWLPDGSEVWFARFSRDFKRLDVLAADASGRVRTVLTETAETFVRIQHSVVYAGQVGFTLLPDGRGFIWQSERDGWSHLYLYSLEGELKNRITRGEFPVLDVQRVDLVEGFVYFTGHAEPRLYDTHLYRVPLDGGEIERLTEGKGQHRSQFSPSGKFFVDTYSSVDTAPVTELRSTGGDLIMELGRADTSALEALGWTPSVEFVVKAADGETDLWGVMHKPHDFDPSRSYPVVEFIYGGPQIAYVVRDFSGASVAGGKFANYPKALAQLGFIVISLDARGTPERSKAFQDVIYGSWGRNEIPDHAGAIKQLGERHAFMDLDRVGIFGHSWGGYFTFRALAQAPEIYRVGVASAPGFDPWEAFMYEPYLGMPEDNKAAYEYASLFAQAPLIKGKLMLGGGTTDHFTFTDVIKMSRTLIDAGVQHDLVVLPGQPHGYFGKSLDYFLEKQTRFFEEHLGPY